MSGQPLWVVATYRREDPVTLSTLCAYWADQIANMDDGGPVPANKITFVRRFIAAGDFNVRAVAKMARTLECSEAEVWDYIHQATQVAKTEVLPQPLAIEESIELGRFVREKAKLSADWKTVLDAQKHIDRMQEQIEREARGAGIGADVIPRSEVVAQLKRIRAALEEIPDEAVRQEALSRLRSALADQSAR